MDSGANPRFAATARKEVPAPVPVRPFVNGLEEQPAAVAPGAEALTDPVDHPRDNIIGFGLLSGATVERLSPFVGGVPRVVPCGIDCVPRRAARPFSGSR